MNDDWSLKGKAKFHTYDGEVIPIYDCVTKEEYLYEYEDIETLRQKLIEDIIDKFYGFYPYDEIDKSHITKDVTKLINKRFGVE